MGTMPVEQRAESSTGTYFTFSSTLLLPMPTFFRRTFALRTSTRMHVKEFRLQLARELMGDYSSRCRAGRRPSQIITLPLRHFPIRIPDESHWKNFKRGRCAYCKVTCVKTPPGFVGNVRFGYVTTGCTLRLLPTVA